MGPRWLGVSGLFRVRLERPWGDAEIELGGILLSTRIPLDAADALLCDFEPGPNLFRARVPSVWFCGEPLTTPRGHHQALHCRFARLRLPARRFLHHAHPDPRYRVPAVAARDHAVFADAAVRVDRAIAVVSYAGSVGRRWPALTLRNRFVTHPRVDLFGRAETWQSYRAGFLSSVAPPQGYRGPLPGGWGDRQKIALSAQYRVAICLENSQEPYYFTEKFVDAVLAGCVPVYQAHPTVRAQFLTGARWIDPADHGFDPGRTIEAALDAPRADWADQNRAWLETAPVRSTRWSEVFARACQIVRAAGSG